MRGIRAKVINGRLVVDEPTTLPEGSVFDLVIDDEGDELDEHERRTLHAAIERSARGIREGKGRSAEEVLRELDRRRES